MFRPRLFAYCLAVLLTPMWGGNVSARQSELPPPANWAQWRPSTSGEDIGLPQGATTAYALGRSLLKHGDTEAALVFLKKAYRLAPKSWKITEVFAFGLAEAGYLHDAVRLYGELVAASPDSLAQRHQYARLLAQTGLSQDALDQVYELRSRGVRDVGLIKLHADLLASLKQVNAAIEIYREASSEDAAHSEDYYLAAASLLEKYQRFEDMADLLREGVERVPASWHLVQSLLRYLVHQGQHARALEEAAAADSRRRASGLSREPDLLLELAGIMLRQGLVSEAQHVLLNAKADGERYQEVETLQARIHLSMGASDEAAAVLKHAIAQWPDQAELRYLLGNALEMQGDHVSAVKQLKDAVALQPEHTAYRIALLRLYVLNHRRLAPGSNGDPDPVVFDKTILEHATLAAASLDAKDSHGHLILGYVFRRMDDLTSACRHFDQAREVNETRLIAGLELSACLQESGKTDEALAILHALHDEFPDDPGAANNLAFSLAEQGGDLAIAERLVRQAVKSDPNNGAYLDTLGWVLYLSGDYADAFHWLIEAVNQRPDDPVILEHLGLTLYRLGRIQEALDILHRAMTCGGDPRHLQELITEVKDER